MEKTDYNALLQHSIMLRKAVTILENLGRFKSVAELEMVRSIIQQLKIAISETNNALAEIDAKRKKTLAVQQRIDRIISVLPIPTIILVAFFGTYKNGQGVLLISFFALLILLMLTMLKNVATTITEIIAIIAIGVVFAVTMYASKSIQGFVTRYSAEISAVSLLYALALPMFAKLSHKTK